MRVPFWYWCWILCAGIAFGSLATWQTIERPEQLCRNMERIHEHF